MVTNINGALKSRDSNPVITGYKCGGFLSHGVPQIIQLSWMTILVLKTNGDLGIPVTFEHPKSGENDLTILFTTVILYHDHGK